MRHRNTDRERRISKIDWTQYQTAYGRADRVAAQLGDLFSQDSQIADSASHDLWCGLCHQHVGVSSAALPALPFIFEALKEADENLGVEILDILLGFSICSAPSFSKGDDPEWVIELRGQMKEHLPLFVDILSSATGDAHRFASNIIESLAD